MRLLNGPSLSEQRHRSPLARSTEQQRVSQGRAFNDLPWPLVSARQLHADGEVCASLNQQLRDQQPLIVELRHCVEDCCLSPDSGLINGGAGIDVCATVKKQRDRGRVAVLRGHMQERSSLKQEAAPAGLTAIELRETLSDERGIGIDEFGQPLQTAAEQWQHSWHIVPGLPTGAEKDVNAGAQSFGGTPVAGHDVVESGASIRMTAELIPMVATIRIGAVVEKPSERVRIHGLAWGKDDGEMSVPQSVYVSAV